MVVHRERLYKQMSLEVGVRNPERYPDILRVINKYEGRILNDDCILSIYADLFVSHAISSAKLKVEEDTDLSTIKSFIKGNLSHNNEWGFPTGYQAAFTRYLKTLSEFGFIYTQYNQVIKISPIGKALVNEEITVSEAFAIQSMRFWRKSPYRRVLNDYNYFKFIMDVIIKLDKKGRKLSYPQFILSLFSDDGNSDNFINEISTIKCGNDINAMYRYIIRKYSEVDAQHPKVNKQQTVVNDYGNTVFRVLQLTGFITIDVSGVILISPNKNNLGIYQYLINQNFSISEDAMEDYALYFEQIGSLSADLKVSILEFREDYDDMDSLDYNHALAALIKQYGFTEDEIINKIKRLQNGKSNSDFWFMDDPLQLEFFITILLYMKYGNDYKIHPNYKADSNGIPYQHAPANIGDIYVTSDDINWLIEVTLIRNRDQQFKRETTNCLSHFEKAQGKPIKYLSFIAPQVHEETKKLYGLDLLDLIMHDVDDVYIKTYDIDNFIDITLKKNNYSDMIAARNEVEELGRKHYSS